MKTNLKKLYRDKQASDMKKAKIKGAIHKELRNLLLKDMPDSCLNCPIQIFGCPSIDRVYKGGSCSNLWKNIINYFKEA